VEKSAEIQIEITPETSCNVSTLSTSDLHHSHLTTFYSNELARRHDWWEQYECFIAVFSHR
jgi:hypothetical protein